jgi:hypothetical protein
MKTENVLRAEVKISSTQPPDYLPVILQDFYDGIGTADDVRTYEITVAEPLDNMGFLFAAHTTGEVCIDDLSLRRILD